MIYEKTPTGYLDYQFDLAPLSNETGDSDWLEADETITAYTLHPDPGITIPESTLINGNTAISFWVSGGVIDQPYEIQARFTTSAGRTDARTMIINCVKR
jgi:hypothetical protein